MDAPIGGCGLLALLLAFVVLFLGVQSAEVSTEVSVAATTAPLIEASAAP